MSSSVDVFGAVSSSRPNIEHQTPKPPVTLIDVLRGRAEELVDHCAYRFLSDEGGETSLSFRQLDEKARALAALLRQHASPGDRALLVFPPGLDFIVGFFGCLYAGVIAVPSTHPKPRRPAPRIRAIVEDCRARLALTTSRTINQLGLDRLDHEFRDVTWFGIDELVGDRTSCDTRPADASEHAALSADSLALLQYTSGSTGNPKGVMVSHGNLLSNLQMIHAGFGIPKAPCGHLAGVGVSWLPHYHDMGLVGGILESLYAGGTTVLMSPTAFLQRPERWLQTISDSGASISGAPNFAYELCVRRVGGLPLGTLDLSCWQVAFCGAEPVRAATLKRFAEAFAPCGFREDAFYPCYGLAETTLLAAGGQGPAKPATIRIDRSMLLEMGVAEATDEDSVCALDLVACGAAPDGQQLVVVDPEKRTKLPEQQVGEIWVGGTHVARGYWNRDEESEELFRARLQDGEGPYLRTGDLGFICDGQLYVTGRDKDLLVIRGRNHYCHDIETTTQHAHSALLPGGGAAFPIEWEGEERLIIVHEVDRAYRNGETTPVIQSIRRAVTSEHELEVHTVVLIRPSTLPRTTSGKVQRDVCRERFLSGELKEVARWATPAVAHRATDPRGKDGGNGTSHSPQAVAGKVNGSPQFGGDVDRLAEEIEARLLAWISARVGATPNELDCDKPFADYGVDSLAAVELSCELEQWLHVRLPAVLAWSHPTPARLARYLAEEALRGANEAKPEEPAAPTPPQADRFEQLLAEIEGMSEQEVAKALGGDDVADPKEV
ncbi:MAG: AMP-binding protein [Planctomycetota bacterium]